MTSLVQHLKVTRPVLCATSRFLAERLKARPSFWIGSRSRVSTLVSSTEVMRDRLGRGKRGTETYTVEGCTSQRRGAWPESSPTNPQHFCSIWHTRNGERQCAHPVVCPPRYPGIDDAQCGKLRCKGIKRMDWRAQEVQHDLEGLIFQLGIWAFCCALGATGPIVLEWMRPAC